MKRFFSLLGLVLAAAVAVSVATATGTARSAAGVERLPVTCYAFWYVDGSVRMAVRTPDDPLYASVVPDHPLPTAQADGVAVFTPSGQVSAVCYDNPLFGGLVEGSPLAGASTSTFTAHGLAYTAREELPRGSFRIRHYAGHGTVVVNHGKVQISAQMQYTTSTP